ncbi:CLUMA_CG015326, isoform A [Clunio marinus]|uniref:CLUMA_CG015326, isoform A n=1 Tax=Clunio marinus TaxID=568069 RepID=A0A1J1IQA8_9DIPT|nr:CLUMA_CG015326, isoform A [Clunio marinus]
MTENYSNPNYVTPTSTMAEKPEDQFSSEEKIAKAKELYARGCRNFYVKTYSDAADDLSEACKLFGEVHGIDGEELGETYLMYAKALIAVGQDENKIVDVPEEDSEDEPAEEDDGDSEVEAEGSEADATKGETKNGIENGENTVNGHEEAVAADEPQPCTSGMMENDNSNDVQELINEEMDDGGNLELAWEVLQNAALIFERQGSKGLNNLMDVYIEMAGISLENGNFEVAINDFKRALNVFLDLEDADQNERINAEIYYKIGLCHLATNAYEESVKSFQKAADIIAEVVNVEKKKEEQTDDVLATIKDLEETQQEILNKIAEIGETKAEEIAHVKKELEKMFGPGVVGESSGAGSSSSAAPSSSSKISEAEKPKATDISHLIKRKKTDSDVECSPAKKQALDTTSGEKINVEQASEQKITDEATATTVQVIEN